MECPKCGAEQPESDTCIKCHVIISKYLRSREREGTVHPGQYPGASQTDAKTGHRHINTIILATVVLAIFGVALFFVPFGKSKGSYDKATGIYQNEEYGFKLTVPASWKTYSVKEAIECQTINEEYYDDYFLLASPTEPTHSMIVVGESGLTAEYFKATPWESIVADTASRHPVSFKSIDTIGELRVHRVGYRIQNAYREDDYFMTNGKLMQIYFYVVSPEQSPELVTEMKNIVEKTLESI